MAFAESFLRKMIIKSTILLLLLHLSIINVTDGHLGCPGSLVPCLNPRDCIEIDQVCIGDHHCVNPKNQTICNHCSADAGNTIACVTEVKRRLVFECLSPSQICNAVSNCLNDDDERSCGTLKCADDFWLCKNGTCVKRDRLCDQHLDCPDGSDEGDICHAYICGLDKFHCRTGECISQSQVCDGVPHCPDEDDEENCPHLTATTVKNSCSIPSNTFSCSVNSICLPNERVCDGYKDCPKGDDENNCDEKCVSKSKCIANPNIQCIQHPSVDQLCRCVQPGYRLTQTNTCQDFDECKDSLGIYCSFNCTNTDGSFNCTCPSGFMIDQETNTCRKPNNPSKPNFLILYDNNLSLYNIWNHIDRYSFKELKRISLGKHHQYNHIQYDPYQMFLIYYDHIQHAVLCKSSLTFKTLLLLSNLTVHALAYNANGRILFLLDNQSRTLRMYTPITCDISHEIQMHSWIFHNHSDAIHSMEIDFLNRQFIFATQYDFLISNMSEPTSTKTVYSTDREINRFIYHPTFKRIFWTTMNKGLFSVHTCDDGFKRCLDTSVVLPVAWPFAFFDDGLLYPSAPKSLDFIQIYGKNRFLDRVLLPTKEKIHSILFLNDQPIQSSNLCTENSSISHCKDQLCLQINPKNISCLSIDASLLSTVLITSDNIDSKSDDDPQSLLDDGITAHSGNQGKKYRYRPSNTILFCIISLGVLVGILAFFVKRCHQRLNQKAIDNEQRQNERCLAADEPNLDEFNIVFDDRHYDRLPLTNQLHY